MRPSLGETQPVITLTLGNSYSTITGLTIAQDKELRSILSFEEDNFGSRPRRRCLLSKRGEFPSGLLDRVKGFLAKCGGQYRLVDSRVKPKPKPGMFKFVGKS
jgi:hypothetical protein